MRIWLLLLCLPLSGFSAVLETKPGSKAVEGVTLAESATLKVNGRNHALRPVGAGLRYKKVVFVKADVYVGQLFLPDPGTFERTETGALGSLQHSDAVAMNMTFLRDVDAAALQSAFQDAFKENGVPVDQEPIRGFLEAVKAGGGAKDKKTILVAGEKADGAEYVTYEDSDGKATTLKGEKGFVQAVFSLWLGKPSDSGVESLKREILKN